MRYVDEFRNKTLINSFAERIKGIAPKSQINIMEVCGTHTQSFFRFGVNKLIPSNIRLISGPGCPVCVSPQEYVDAAIKLSKRKDTLIVTFGDMLRIPGSHSSLEQERAKLGNVRLAYSPLDSIKIAKHNPDKEVVFLAVGFETTAPTFSLTILEARKQKIPNLSFLCSLKLIPPAMKYLVSDKQLNLQGFLCPGHVSAIIGTAAYEFIPKEHKIGCCVCGFEPLDILESIYLLLCQVKEDKFRVDNQYSRVVSRQGNPTARRLISRVFEKADSSWRGFGKIKGSGLEVRKEFAKFDAEERFGVKIRVAQESRVKKCICAQVLKGRAQPSQCPQFSKTCTPVNPVGPCMVSHEGACNAYYRYR